MTELLPRKSQCSLRELHQLNRGYGRVFRQKGAGHRRATIGAARIGDCDGRQDDCDEGNDQPGSGDVHAGHTMISTTAAVILAPFSVLDVVLALAALLGRARDRMTVARARLQHNACTAQAVVLRRAALVILAHTFWQLEDERVHGCTALATACSVVAGNHLAFFRGQPLRANGDHVVTRASP